MLGIMYRALRRGGRRLRIDAVLRSRGARTKEAVGVSRAAAVVLSESLNAYAYYVRAQTRTHDAFCT